MLEAGFSSACITPPPGRDVPGLFERRLAKGVHDDLYARATVIGDASRRVAMVQVDAITAPEALVREARRLAHAWCGIDPADCMIAATHTHSGGPVFAGFLGVPDSEYLAFAAHQIASAIAEAYRRRQPAHIGTGRALAEGVAYNRRFIMRNGSCMTHPGKGHPDIVCPAGAADPTVTVTGFRSPDAWQPFGALVHFACHATHMNGLLYSADYVRWVVETLRAVYGPDFGIVFLNGACGDVTQVDNLSARPLELGPYWCERTGRTVGSGALQVLARMDYFREAGIARATTRISARVRSSQPEEVRTARALLAKRPVSATEVETIYAMERLEVEKTRRKQPVRKLEVMGVRLADAVYWGVPGEYFQELSAPVRERSPFLYTCCIELANGYNGYLCTEAAYAGGGYETRLARSSLMAPDTGARIARAAEGLIRKMHRAAAAELAVLPERRIWPAFDDPSVLDGIGQLHKK
jgi:hypothetical protein